MSNASDGFGFVSFHKAVTRAIKEKFKIQNNVIYGEQVFTIDLSGKVLIIFYTY